MVAEAAGGTGEVRQEMKTIDFPEGREGHTPGDHRDGATLPTPSTGKGWTTLLQMLKAHAGL